LALYRVGIKKETLRGHFREPFAHDDGKGKGEKEEREHLNMMHGRR
jgi:hypothetical protein